jgi:hypothetical protein
VASRVAASGDGAFVDYGCGEGALLRVIAGTGRPSVGVEVDPEVAATVAKAYGIPVVSPEQLGTIPPTVGIVHFGDVLEHVPKPSQLLHEVMSLLPVGARVVAQGPLEGNANLFAHALKVTGWLRRDRPSTFPPYHLHLASATGQRELFRRVGLDEVAWEVTEVNWPAPASLRECQDRRSAALLVLRRASRAVGTMVPTWGNRYRYEGRVTSSA